MQKRTKWIVATVGIIIVAALLIFFLVRGMSGDKLIDMGRVITTPEDSHTFVVDVRGHGFAGFDAESDLAHAFGINKETFKESKDTEEYKFLTHLEDWAFHVVQDTSKLPTNSVALEQDFTSPELLTLHGLAFFDMKEEDFKKSFNELSKNELKPLTITDENVKPLGQSNDIFFGYTMRRGKVLLMITNDKDRLLRIASRVKKLPEKENLPAYPEKKDGLSCRYYIGVDALKTIQAHSGEVIKELSRLTDNKIALFYDAFSKMLDYKQPQELFFQLEPKSDAIKLSYKLNKEALENYSFKLEDKQPDSAYSYLGTGKLLAAIGYSLPGLPEDLDLNQFLTPFDAQYVNEYLKANNLTVKDLLKVLKGRTTLTLSQSQEPAGPLNLALRTEYFPESIVNQVQGMANFFLSPSLTQNIDSKEFKGLVTRIPGSTYNGSIGITPEGTTLAFGNAAKMKNLDLGDGKILENKSNQLIYIDFPAVLEGLKSMPELTDFARELSDPILYNLNKLEMKSNMLEGELTLTVKEKEKQLPVELSNYPFSPNYKPTVTLNDQQKEAYIKVIEEQLKANPNDETLKKMLDELKSDDGSLKENEKKTIEKEPEITLPVETPKLETEEVKPTESEEATIEPAEKPASAPDIKPASTVEQPKVDDKTVQEVKEDVDNIPLPAGAKADIKEEIEQKAADQN